MSNGNWNVLIGPICVLVGIFISLYIKDKSRDIAKSEFETLIKGVMAHFKLELLRDLDLVYVRAAEQKLHFGNHDDRMDAFDDELTVIRARITHLEQKHERSQT